MHLLLILFIGAVAGALAGLIVRGEGFGLLVDIIVGIVGGWIGWKLFGGILDVFHQHPIINGIITATIGAIILTLIIRLLRGWR